MNVCTTAPFTQLRRVAKLIRDYNNARMAWDSEGAARVGDKLKIQRELWKASETIARRAMDCFTCSDPSIERFTAAPNTLFCSKECRDIYWNTAWDLNYENP